MTAHWRLDNMFAFILSLSLVAEGFFFFFFWIAALKEDQKVLVGVLPVQDLKKKKNR